MFRDILRGLRMTLLLPSPTRAWRCSSAHKGRALCRLQGVGFGRTMRTRGTHLRIDSMAAMANGGHPVNTREAGGQGKGKGTAPLGKLPRLCYATACVID